MAASDMPHCHDAQGKVRNLCLMKRGSYLERNKGAERRGVKVPETIHYRIKTDSGEALSTCFPANLFMGGLSDHF